MTEEEERESRLARIARLGLVGGGTGAALSGLAGLAATRSPGWALMAASRGIVPGAVAGAGYGALTRRKRREELSSKLDNLIEFASPITIAGRNPAVAQTVWNRIKKPSRKTLGGILRTQDYLTGRMPTMVFRNNPKLLEEKLDRLIEFAADTRPRNDLGMFTSQSEGPDPNAMAKTYQAPKPVSEVAGIAGSAAIAGAAGTGAGLLTKDVYKRLKAIKLGRK